MNPIHVNCPECQKLFMVETSSLAEGQARFQCTDCEGFFAFNWPQPPGMDSVRAHPLDGRDFVPQGKLPKAEATVKTVEEKVLQTCARCGESSETSYKECPRCGVLFNKVKSLKPQPAVMPPSGPEVTSAWEAVKAQYVDEKRHEHFIQICLNRDNLAFASSQYRAILNVNPHDETAVRMQNRIIELATAAYVAAQPRLPEKSKGRFRAMGMMGGVAACLILVGIALPAARGLIPVGCALGVFVWVFRNFNKLEI